MLKNSFITLAWVIWIQIAAWGVGRPIYRLLIRKGEGRGGRDRIGSRPEADLGAVFSVALGFVALAYIAFAQASAHLLYSPLVAGLAVVFGLAGLLQIRRCPAFRWSRPSIHHAPLVLGVLFAASFLFQALSPILLHDDNVYHLLIPKLYLQSHELLRMPANLYANMPHIIEVLYTLPMAIGDFTAPKVLALSFSTWTIVALYLATRPSLGRFGAGLVPLLYLSGKNLQWHLGSAYVEPVIGFFLLTAVLALLAWRETGNRGFLRILALVCGFCLAAKYSAWFYVAAILAVVLFLLLTQRGTEPLRRRAGMAVETAAIALILLAPWLIKSALFTGNPIYPNLYKLLGGVSWSEIQEMHYLRSQAVAGGSDKTLLSYLLLPWRLITDEEGFFAPCFSIGLMALWLLTLLRSAVSRKALLLPAVSLLGFLGWAFSVEQGRFLVAWVPVMALTAGTALVPLRRNVRVMAAVSAVVLGLGILQIVAQKYPYAPPLGQWARPRAEALKDNENYSVCALLNKELPADGKVLALWENRLFFLQRSFRADGAYEAPTGLAQLRSAESAAAFARELAASGVTHVVINTAPASMYLENKLPFSLLDDRLYPASRLEADGKLLMSLVESELEPLAREGTVCVYRLRAGDPAARKDGGSR